MNDETRPPAGGAAPKQRCPLCGRPRAPDYAPFCSRNCRDRDLLRWLDGTYRIPGRPAPTHDDGDAER